MRIIRHHFGRISLVLCLLLVGTVSLLITRHAIADSVPPGHDEDHDGLHTKVELYLGLDPFDPDTDDDGLLDGEEITNVSYNGNLNNLTYTTVSNPKLVDSDGDGASDRAERDDNTDPNGHADTTDSDGDGLVDSEDAVAGDALIDWKLVETPRYVLVGLGSDTDGRYPMGLAENGTVLFQQGIWKSGQFSEFVVPEKPLGSVTSGDELEPYEVNESAGYAISPDGEIVLADAWASATEGRWVEEGVGWNTISVFESDGFSAWDPLKEEGILLRYPIGISNNRVFSVHEEPLPPYAKSIGVYSMSGNLISSLASPTEYEPVTSLYQMYSDVTPMGWLAINQKQVFAGGGGSARQLGVWKPGGEVADLPQQGNGHKWPVHLTDMVGGKVAVVAGNESYKSDVLLQNSSGQFEASAHFAGSSIRIMGGNGTALGSDLKLWANGEWIELENWCPELADEVSGGWDFTIIDANSSGAYLLLQYTLGEDGYVIHTKLLLPVEVKHVDRDVMIKQWEHRKPYNASTALYAGPHSGDMIEWRIAGVALASQAISWEAEHLDSEEMITGPSGTGLNFWRIGDEDGNDPSGDEWLKWKPGEYAIFCEIFGERLEVYRIKVGYRSDHVLVIGQIVPTFTHDPDKPLGTAATSWAEGVADDFVNTVLPAAAPASVYDTMADGLKTVFASQSEKGAEAWAASWAGALGVPPGIIPSWFPSGWVPPPVAPISLPPASSGPAVASFGGIHGPVGIMTANHHYWATQHMLNTNPDTPKVPLEIYVKSSEAPSEDQAFAYIFTERQYRICHDFQAKFLLDDDGKIDQTTFEARHNRAANGPTKMKIGEVTAGDWGTVYSSMGIGLPPLATPLPPFDIKPFPDEPSETNSHNGEVSHDSTGEEVSSFATARIGEKGRRVSYRQFGKDAPWIFSEIIFALDNDGKVNLTGRTSTTVQWNLVVKPDKTEVVTVERSPHANLSTPGISIFNNLNLYTRSEIDRFVRLNGGLLEMEGYLKSFVESGSGAWPEPAIPPTVK